MLLVYSQVLEIDLLS